MANPTDTLIHHLLELHTELLKLAKSEYERDHGPIAGATAYLQLVTEDPSFAWLRPLSRLIVDLEETEAPRALAEKTFAEGNAFSERYLNVLKENEPVVLVHGDVKRAMSALPA